MVNNLFVYGSLINPLSLSSRLSESGITEEIYDNDIGLCDYYDRSEHIELWEELHSEGVTVHDVKIDGFRRTYGLKHRDAGMLEVRESKGSYINGIIYEGLSDELFERVSSSEEGYNVKYLESSDFEFYGGEVPTFDTDVACYYPIQGEPSKINKHEVYHSNILKGFVFLKENDLVTDFQSFVTDYCETTYEYTDTEWVVLAKTEPNIVKKLSELNADNLY